MSIISRINDLQDEWESDGQELSAREALDELKLPVLKEWISGTTRWTVVKSVVTESDGHLWEIIWHEPATEMQEFEPRQWLARRVRPVQSEHYEPMEV